MIEGNRKQSSSAERNSEASSPSHITLDRLHANISRDDAAEINGRHDTSQFDPNSGNQIEPRRTTFGLLGREIGTLTTNKILSAPQYLDWARFNDAFDGHHYSQIYTRNFGVTADGMSHAIADPLGSFHLPHGLPSTIAGANIPSFFAGQPPLTDTAYSTLTGSDHSPPLHPFVPPATQDTQEEAHQLCLSFSQYLPDITLHSSTVHNPSSISIPLSFPGWSGDHLPIPVASPNPLPPTTVPSIASPASPVERSPPSDPGTVHAQCRLRLHDGRWCDACFDVEPNFKAKSPYGRHLSAFHGVPLGQSKGSSPLPWICTWKGCRCKGPGRIAGRCEGYPTAHAAHTHHPLTHIRSHLDHRFRCDRCGHAFQRRWLLARHQARNCQTRHGPLSDEQTGKAKCRRREKKRTSVVAPLPRPRLVRAAFQCPYCGRPFDSGDKLVDHQDSQECVAGTSSSD